MVISVPAGVMAALESETGAEAYLAALPGGLWLTDWGSDLDYDGNTYVADGRLLKVSDVKREAGLTLHTYLVTLSNVDQVPLALYANTNYRGIEATIYRVFLDESNAIIDGFALIDYIGTLDSWRLPETLKKSEFELKLTNDWAALEFASGRFTNPSSQEGAFPGDTFFDMAHEDKNAIGWGKQ